MWGRNKTIRSALVGLRTNSAITLCVYLAQCIVLALEINVRSDLLRHRLTILEINMGKTIDRIIPFGGVCVEALLLNLVNK